MPILYFFLTFQIEIFIAILCLAQCLFYQFFLNFKYKFALQSIVCLRWQVTAVLKRSLDFLTAILSKYFQLFLFCQNFQFFLSYSSFYYLSVCLLHFHFFLQNIVLNFFSSCYLNKLFCIFFIYIS